MQVVVCATQLPAGGMEEGVWGVWFLPKPLEPVKIKKKEREQEGEKRRTKHEARRVNGNIQSSEAFPA